MLYEYCDTIKNSGINRDAFPASCTSFMEMGMYIELDAIKEFNKIYKEAGIVELTRYKNNAITEADDEVIKKTVGQRIQGAWKKVMAGIKAAWEAVVKFVSEKVGQFQAKFGKKFNKIDFDQYKNKIAKVFSGSTYTIANISEIENVEKAVEDAYNKLIPSENILKLGTESATKLHAGYGAILSDAFHDSSLNDISDEASAKKAIDEKLNKKSDNITLDYIKNNKDELYKIITTSTLASVKRAYHKAKVGADKAAREFTKSQKDENMKQADSLKFKLALHYQNILLHLADVRKQTLKSALFVVGRCCIACTGKDTKDEEKKEAKNESTVVYNTDFVNEVFNW